MVWSAHSVASTMFGDNNPGDHPLGGGVVGLGLGLTEGLGLGLGTNSVAHVEGWERGVGQGQRNTQQQPPKCRPAAKAQAPMRAPVCTCPLVGTCNTPCSKAWILLA